MTVALALGPGAKFALVAGTPQALGALSEARLAEAKSWVSGEGLPKEEALSFRRRGRPGSFRLTQIEGRDDLWVVLPVPKGVASAKEGSVTQDSYVPPSHFSGRLVPLREASLMMDPIAEMIRSEGGSASDFVLLEGDTPKNHSHLLAATIALALISVGCLSSGAYLLRRST